VWEVFRQGYVIALFFLVVMGEMQAFADAILVIPKTLAENSGFDVQVAITPHAGFTSPLMDSS